MIAVAVNLTYLLAASLFIFGLKRLSHPKTAVRGNFYGALGTLLAVLATLARGNIISYQFILVGLAIGAVIGVIFAYRTPMTNMPQLVAVFNGFGGAASALVAGAALVEAVVITETTSIQLSVWFRNGTGRGSNFLGQSSCVRKTAKLDLGF